MRVPPAGDNNSIDKLEKSLYSRAAPDVRTRRKLRYGDLTSEVPKQWDRPPEQPEEPVNRDNHRTMTFFTKLLVGSIIFCVVAVGLGAYLFLNGANLISANNIDITVAGPISVPGGTPVSFDVAVSNSNSVALQMTDLSVEFPAGTADSQDPSRELSTYRELIGDIASGGSAKRTIGAIIFGEENTQKQIIIAVTYKIKGSSSIFKKTKTYDLLINSSPVTLTVDSLKELTSGQEFDLKVTVKSNSQDVLKNILVAGTFPFGWTYLSSDLKPLPDNATWRLGDIAPGKQRELVVHGKLVGENQDTRVFGFAVGAQSSRNPNTLGTEYMRATREIALEKPFITVGISLDNDSGTGDAVGEFNQPVHVEVSWFNNLETTISDAQITLKLSGTAYDKTLVQPGNGYFRSATDEIVWNQQAVPALASVGAGESGKVNFSVTPRDYTPAGLPPVNPTITFSANISGRRTQESGVPESLSSVAVRNDRISSVVSLSGQVMRTLGPFANTGPIPPRADAATTYTVFWTIENTVNTVNGAQVTAKLPAGVKWLNATYPPTEDIRYDAGTGAVTWNVGVVGTNTMVNGQRRQGVFQISFEPNVNQVGTAPALVGDAKLTCTDEFTGVALTSIQRSLTTSFSTDPAFHDGDQTVGK